MANLRRERARRSVGLLHGPDATAMEARLRGLKNRRVRFGKITDELFRLFWPLMLAKPDAGATAVLINELDSGTLQGLAHCLNCIARNRPPGTLKIYNS